MENEDKWRQQDPVWSIQEGGDGGWDQGEAAKSRTACDVVSGTPGDRDAGRPAHAARDMGTEDLA